MGLVKEAAEMRLSKSGKGVNFLVKGGAIYTAWIKDLQEFVEGKRGSVAFARIEADKEAGR